MSLSVHVTRITIEAAEAAPILLDEYPGSSLRGALFEALLRRFCMNPSATTCALCPLNATCPVATLVAPLRDEGPRGRDIPRPFVLAPTLPSLAVAAPTSLPALNNETFQVIAPGQRYSFDLSLIGRVASLFPYVAMSVPTIEVLGLGRRQQGRRGRPRTLSIEAVDPFGSAIETLYTRGQQNVRAPTLSVTPATIGARAAALPTKRLTLRFLTPTRLIAQGQLMRRPEPRVLVARLLERLEALEREYGSAHMAGSPGVDGAGEARGIQEPGEVAGSTQPRCWGRLVELAERVRLVADETRWVDVASYSARQRRTTPIGGFVGSATYEGELAELRELLVWGEVLHVGKNAVKGDGVYRIEG